MKLNNVKIICAIKYNNNNNLLNFCVKCEAENLITRIKFPRESKSERILKIESIYSC